MGGTVMNSNDYTFCYVAFLDVLGFKEKIKNRTCQDILNIYKNIKNPLKAAYVGDENGKAQLIEASKKVKTKVMSDSVCFYIEASEPDALLVLISCCSIFQAKLLKMEEPVLIRGGIVVGNMFAEGDTTFGPGLSNAYLLEEKCAKYPRIIMTKETFDLGKTNVSKPILAERLEGMVYGDSDEYIVVNCYQTLKDINEDKKEDCSQLVVHIETVLSTSTDESIRAKYLYIKRNLHARG